MERHKRVLFTYLDFYLFGRCLGSDKVPESGNNPLGMERCHFSKSRVDLLCQERISMLSNEDCIMTSTPHANGTAPLISIPKFPQDSLQSVLSIDYTPKSLQPLNPRQRIKCLKDSGVELIKDQLWTDEGKLLVRLRQDRQQVGCKCTGTSLCDPVRCTCSREGIPCQSDGTKFPCKCGPTCRNESGRRAYSHMRTKYHYKHTFERDLTEDILAMISASGDCQICNEVSEETLQKLFAAPAAQKRKRIGNVSSKQDTKLPKETLSGLEIVKKSPDKIIPFVQSTVMTVSSIVPVMGQEQPFNYDVLFEAAKSPGKGVGKENLGFIEHEKQGNEKQGIICSTPLQPKFVLFPTQVRGQEQRSSWFNDSWSHGGRSQEEVEDPVLNESIYWSSFLNKEPAITTHPLQETCMPPVLNDIDLRPSVCDPWTPKPKLVDYSIDSLSSSFQDAASPDSLSINEMILPSPIVRTVVDPLTKKTYTLRKSTTGFKQTYFVSPKKKNRTKKIGKITFGAQKRCAGARLPRKTARPVVLSPEKSVVGEEECLTHDIADISLIQFVDIDARNDEEAPTACLPEEI